MKTIILVVLVALVAVATARHHVPRHPRGCVMDYIMGRCLRECEEGTHAYTSRCRQVMPEATCAEPNPVPKGGNLCDYSACYCDAGTVRDQKTNKCVPLDQCS